MATVSFRAPVETPMFSEPGKMTRAWQEWYGTLGNKLNDALSGLQSLTGTKTGFVTNATAVDAPVAISGSDSIDLTDLNTKLSTLTTQINAIVTIVNDIKNNLIQAELMNQS
jgi:hypothetical protein